MQDVLSPSAPTVVGGGSFASAAHSVLDHLRAELGFELVMLTRREGPACIVLDVLDEHFGVRPGLVLPWARTFCARVSNGEAPRAAPDTEAIPAFVQARADLRVEVGAYLSVELRGEDDQLFGTLCAASPRRQERSLERHLPLMDLLAGLLGRLLSHEFRDERQARRVERAEMEAATDTLTEVGNRRLWDRLLASEEARCRRYGSTAGIVVVDLDGLKEVNDLQGHRAGDTLLRRTAEVIQDRVQESDLVARLGGDEFGVLLAETHAEGVAAVVERLRAALHEAGIPASVGGGVRLPKATLAEAWREADDRMYESKRARRNAVHAEVPATGILAVAGVDVTQRVTSDSRPDPLETLVRTAREELGLQVAFVSEIVGDRQVFRSISSTIPLPIGPGDERPLSETFCQKILDGELPAVIPDTRAVPAAAELAISALIGSYIAVPIRLPDGCFYGTFCAFSHLPELRLRESDVALLETLAKAAGEVLRPQRQAEERRHRVLEEVDAVLSAGGPVMRYQPIVCLETGVIEGVEALSAFPKDNRRTTARWFEDAALLGAATALELAAASTALQLLPKLPGFLSLNVSVETLCAPRFARLMADQPVDRIVIEVSEHDPITDYGPVLAALAPLRGRGLRLAIDDAGAGFASLRHVLQLEPDLVKLDVSLVRDVATDPARQALATALLGFAEKIGATVVAEGIEVPQELAMLRELDVAFGQGFLISRPLPADMWDGAVAPALPLPRTKAVAG